METGGICHNCGTELPAAKGVTTGYGEDSEGHKYCYECCGTRDREAMITTGRAVLYYVTRGRDHSVTNWPGSLVLRVKSYRKGRHNIAGVRYDVWFTGPDGKPPWHDTRNVANTRRPQISVTRRGTIMNATEDDLEIAKRVLAPYCDIEEP